MMLRLNSNEGVSAPPELLADLARADIELLRRYPDVAPLEQTLAAMFGVGAERVIITAGADEAIDRICRAYLEPGRTLLLPDPSFDMFDRFAALANGEVTRVPWTADAFPADAFASRIDARTAVIAIVSPNNPTGGVATRADVRRLAAAAPQALILLDHAYVEYADDDLTLGVLDLPNVVVVRTLSKAWGLAGCRIGYAVGEASVMAVLRAAGGPYPVAGPSIALALARLRDGAASLRPHVTRIREERAALSTQLAARGVRVRASQANFVLADFGPRASFVWAALRAQNVLVRDFPGRPSLEGQLRITLPGDSRDFAQLSEALDLALAPDALVFDLDGVLADVRDSQRATIIETGRSYGVTITQDDIAAAMRAGDASNDWILTRRLLADRGVRASLADVTARFQTTYLGTPAAGGLREREQLLCSCDLLAELSARLPTAIVTGRPGDEARWFLQRAGITGSFRTLVCMEDAAAKPDPAPVRLAMRRLGAQRAWMLGNTPDDVRAALGAGALPLGIVAPGDDVPSTTTALLDAGAARVLRDVAELLELLP
ncbi:MAG: aminotransferase class I/II-fold pyridoxal phosphate-dependent enzyme [Gemmatimonadota bacterium]